MTDTKLIQNNSKFINRNLEIIKNKTNDNEKNVYDLFLKHFDLTEFVKETLAHYIREEFIPDFEFVLKPCIIALINAAEHYNLTDSEIKAVSIVVINRATMAMRNNHTDNSLMTDTEYLTFNNETTFKKVSPIQIYLPNRFTECATNSTKKTLEEIISGNQSSSANVLKKISIECAYFIYITSNKAILKLMFNRLWNQRSYTNIPKELWINKLVIQLQTTRFKSGWSVNYAHVKNFNMYVTSLGKLLK
jgi:hypothetical protein